MKRFTAALVGFIAVFNPFDSLARSNHDHHVQLTQTALQTGIIFRINPPMCDTEEAFGWYWADKNELAVCQSNKVTGLSMEVSWSEEDYDTLRHEVHHLVQDCMAREDRDGILGAVYQDPQGLGREVLGVITVNQISRAYSDKDEHTILMEVEAFSVARMNDPLEQIRDIQKYCM